ncbi:hypothetical protein ACXR0O_14490 [Verrucomicrobiota bacterium sgz303538]
MNTPPTITNDPNFREYRSGDPARERVLLLGLIYLQAGLPPEAAYRSALADYVCGFDDTLLLAS